MLFICYPKCTTCQRARKWLDQQGVSYTLRDIKEDRPTREELSAWWKASRLPLKKFFNTSGQLYKSLGLKDRLKDMTEEEQLTLLATDGMLSSGRSWWTGTGFWWASGQKNGRKNKRAACHTEEEIG